MSSLRINECIHWLWAASRGFRLSVVYCTLAGSLNVSVSLFFVFVCKHLIDIATGVSDDSLGTYIGWMAATERLTELTSLPLERQGKSVRLTGNLGIRISHVRFSYSDSGREVLTGFSHDFRPGSLTAIVGETGVGKSTLIKLILALVQPKEGNIVIYNEQEEVTASPQTRCNLSYVPQGNTLFSGTIRDNLLIGNPNATEEDMRSALHTAVADFVFSLPGGLDTACGEQGTGLSEGQAQRIAIARGLLRPGNILLLDEPSSALDGETEKELLRRLAKEVTGRTVVLITHRERIAGLCSKVVRMKEYRLEFK